MRYLLWGFQSPTMESLLAEGIGLVAGDHSADNQTHPTANTAIKLIDLAGGLYGHTNEVCVCLYRYCLPRWYKL